MKPLPAIIAISLIFVMASPVFTAFATAETVAFTSPVSGSAVPAGAFTISGTVTPAPGAGDYMYLQVTNPSGALVGVQSVPVSNSNGDFSWSTQTGSGTQWPSGSYKISGTDDNGATGTDTFTFTQTSGSTTTGSVVLQVTAAAASPVLAGNSVGVSALVAWSNGTVPSSVTFAGWWISPSGVASKLTSTPSSPTAGVYWWTLTAPAAAGLNAIVLGATVGTTTAWTQTSFTVSNFATSKQVGDVNGNVSSLAGMVSSLQSTVNSIQSSVSSLVTSVNGLGPSLSGLSTQLTAVGTSVTNGNAAAATAFSNIQSTLSGVQNSLTGITNSLSTLSTAVNSANTAAGNAATSAAAAQASAKSAQDAISSTQTYVLAVAVIAAITLVLELAILVRKLS